MKIVLQNLTKRYPNRNKKIKEDVIAVNNFNFEIPDGQLPDQAVSQPQQEDQGRRDRRQQFQF